jgi:hypothetical protein
MTIEMQGLARCLHSLVLVCMAGLDYPDIRMTVLMHECKYCNWSAISILY